MTPIWKDYLVTFTNSAPSSGVEYTLYNDSLGYFYYGLAYARPGASSVVARINDQVATLFKRGLTFLGETDVPYLSVETEASSLTFLDNENFSADWSYDPDFNSTLQGLNFPICDILLPGQRVPCSRPTSVNVSFVVSHPAASAGEYNADFNADFTIMGGSSTTETIANGGAWKAAWLNLRDYPTATAVEVAGLTYRVGGGCGQYALYYVNAYGGWDTLAVLANTKRVDALTHYNLDKEYSNTATHNRGRQNYVNEVVTKLTFYTHYLTDEQSARMHHLLNSPTVYLHDVEKNHVWPIVLTGSSNERKRNGLNQYAIDAELAQNRIRR